MPSARLRYRHGEGGLGPPAVPARPPRPRSAYRDGTVTVASVCLPRRHSDLASVRLWRTVDEHRPQPTCRSRTATVASLHLPQSHPRAPLTRAAAVLSPSARPLRSLHARTLRRHDPGVVRITSDQAAAA